MMACTQPGSERKPVRRIGKVQALMSRRASGGFGHAVNFARGVLVGGIFVLFVWLMVG